MNLLNPGGNLLGSIRVLLQESLENFYVKVLVSFLNLRDHGSGYYLVVLSWNLLGLVLLSQGLANFREPKVPFRPLSHLSIILQSHELLHVLDNQTYPIPVHLLRKFGTLHLLNELGILYKRF